MRLPTICLIATAAALLAPPSVAQTERGLRPVPAGCLAAAEPVRRGLERPAGRNTAAPRRLAPEEAGRLAAEVLMADDTRAALARLVACLSDAAPR